jgi:hypothetical protein
MPIYFACGHHSVVNMNDKHNVTQAKCPRCKSLDENGVNEPRDDSGEDADNEADARKEEQDPGGGRCLMCDFDDVDARPGQ